LPHFPPSPSPETPAPHPRIAALDAARAFGVVAMVAGHTLDALLVPEVRAHPAVALYWQARGFTAPLFLLVSGWAVAASMSRGPLQGAAAVAGRLPRVLLLLAVGLALRWPGWDAAALLRGDAGAWRHLLAFDALHAIALALLAAAVVFALPLSRAARTLLLAALAAASVILAWLPPGAPASTIAGIALEQAAGGTSPFPLFPWAAYFFAGAVLGVSVERGGPRTAAAVGAAGALLALPFAMLAPADFAPAHPVLVGLRAGAVLLALALLFAVPPRLARAAAPLGKASLGVYVLHVPLVYGWSTHAGLAARVGATLGIAQAVAVAAAVLAASYAAVRAWALVRSGLPALATALASAASLRGARGE
jgi:uncharacterized membrane protein